MAAPEGICIATTGAPLDAAPTWDRIDQLDGLTIQRVSITRGRSSETDKTAVGTCTITGTDRKGILDRTNTTGPFYGNLDPVKQVAVAWQNPNNSAWSTRFRGYWDELLYTIDPSGKFATFQLDCVDALDLLSDAEVIPGYAGAGSSVCSGCALAAAGGNACYCEQPVHDRILAAIEDAATVVLGMAWPSALLSIFSGNVICQLSIYSTRTPLLQVIEDACDAEFPMVANFYVSKDGILTFRGRYARFHPDVAAYDINKWKVGDVPAFNADSATAVLSSDNASTPFVYTCGKGNLINAAYCAPQGIAGADIPGQLVYDTTSITNYGVRVASFEGLMTARGDEATPLNANDENKLMGTYAVDNYKTPQNRPQALTLRSKPPDSPCAIRNNIVLASIELGDIVTLTTTHPGGGGFAAVDHFVEQIKEEWIPRGGEAKGDDITMTLEVSPRAYFDTNPFTGDIPPSS